jgi:hypothetical protein
VGNYVRNCYKLEGAFSAKTGKDVDLSSKLQLPMKLTTSRRFKCDCSLFIEVKVILYIVLLLFSYSAYGQVEKRCELLKQICENEKVQKALKLDHSASPMALITENAEFRSCSLSRWQSKFHFDEDRV